MMGARLFPAFGAVLLLAAALLPGPAPAEALEVLVEERARSEFGPTLPDSGDFDITFQAGAADDAVMLSDFWMDRATGQFVANAVLPGGRIQRVVGLATVTVPVPVPQRRILPDTVLRASDLTTVRLPLARVGAFAVTEQDQLIGKQVRRVLSQGRPVMAQSVMEPLVIGRGDLVTISFNDGRLKLTAPGRAMGDAARGEEVKIVNLISNSSVRGVAKAKGLVEVIN